MGTKRNLFVTLAITGVTAAATLFPGQSSAGVLPGPKPLVLAANASSMNVFSSHTGSSRSLAMATSGKHWAAGSSHNTDIGSIRAGSNHSDWTRIPRLPHGGRASITNVSLGVYGKLANDKPSRFNRENALVVMHTNDNWPSSRRSLGRQFKSQLTEWSDLKTEWTKPDDSDLQAQWKPAYKPKSKYRTVSEFCSQDISQEFSSKKGCTRYSQSIHSVLRIMDNFINWMKGLWGHDGRA